MPQAFHLNPRLMVTERNELLAALPDASLARKRQSLFEENITISQPTRNCVCLADCKSQPSFIRLTLVRTKLSQHMVIQAV